MENIDSNINFDLPKNRSNVIKVIGVGGGGSNAINYMFDQGINGVDFVVTNTDSQALEKSPVPIKIQLGASLTEGLGAGANPEIGRKAAEESYNEIKTLIATNTKMVFITAGMGGGTGTGALPVIASIAKKLGIVTVAIVSTPFNFEGTKRMNLALQGLEEVKNNVDTLLIIPNQNLFKVSNEQTSFAEAFKKADNVLFDGDKVSGMIDLYYACTDKYIYDIAIALNDWCIDDMGEIDIGKMKTFINGYDSLRKLEGDEVKALPTHLRLAAFRFWLSRLYDFHNIRQGENITIKDPKHFKNILIKRQSFKGL